MFTARRQECLTVTHLRGVRADGGWVALPWRLAGRGGMNQVRKQLRRTARRIVFASSFDLERVRVGRSMVATAS